MAEPQPSSTLGSGPSLPTATAITERDVGHYRPPVMAAELNFHWADNLREPVVARMIETLSLNTVVPQLHTQGGLTTGQYARLISASPREINSEFLSILQHETMAETFVLFVNLLRDSTDPVQRQLFATLTASELFVIDANKQLDALIATERDALREHLPVRDLTDFLWQEDCIDSSTQQRIDACFTRQEGVDILLDTLQKGGPARWDHFIETLASSDWVYLPRIAEVLARLEQQHIALQPTTATLSIDADQLPVGPSESEGEAFVGMLGGQHIRPDWQERFIERYRIEAASKLQLSPRYLAQLNKDRLIDSALREQAECAAPGEMRNFLLLHHIKQSGTQQSLALFLNFLQESGAQVASHAALYKDMVADAGIMITPIQPRPSGTLEPETDPCAVTIDGEQIHSRWQEGLRTAYWLQTKDSLQLSPTFLAMLEQDRIIDSAVLQQVEKAHNDRERSMLVVNHMLNCGVEQTLACFLNFLNKTQGQVPEHGVLFGKMVTDLRIMKKTVSLPSTDAVLMENSGTATAALYRKVLEEKWDYLAQSLETKNIQDKLHWFDVISDELRKQIGKSTERTANHLLLNHLYFSENDEPWQRFLEVVGLEMFRQDSPVLKRIQDVLAAAVGQYSRRL